MTAWSAELEDEMLEVGASSRGRDRAMQLFNELFVALGHSGSINKAGAPWATFPG